MTNFKNYALIFIGVSLIVLTIGLGCFIIGSMTDPKQNYTFIGTMLKTMTYYGIGIGLFAPVFLAIKLFAKVDFD